MTDVTASTDRLTAQQIEGRLTAALATIRDLWDEMLTAPAKRPGSKGGGGVLLDDHAESDADTPRLIRVVDVRHQVTATLNGWCRVTVEDHDVEHHIPSGHDVKGMCDFLTRWAPRMAEHDAARELLDEVSTARAKVERIARPQRQEGLRLGACPLTWQAPETAEDKPCPGRLVGTDDGWVTCDRCGTRAVAGWWEAHMTGEDRGDIETRTVTVAEIVDLARSQFGQRIQPAAVWQWVNRSRLCPVDPDAKPHRFRTKDVVVLLMRRAG